MSAVAAVPSDLMARHCARPGCNTTATATFNFDGLERVVWLGPLDDASARSAGDLCRDHADRLRPPLHWELRDARPTPAASAATAAPSRQVAPAAPPPLVVRAPLVVRTPEGPVDLVARQRRPKPVDPRSPLLSRAFRAAQAG